MRGIPFLTLPEWMAQRSKIEPNRPDLKEKQKSLKYEVILNDIAVLILIKIVKLAWISCFYKS